MACQTCVPNCYNVHIFTRTSQSFMERKRLETERKLREEKRAAAAPAENRTRVLQEEAARARKVRGPQSARVCGERGVGVCTAVFPTR